MSSLQSASTIIMVEVIVILLALMGYLIFRYLRSNRDVMSAMQKLTNNIHNHKAERLSTLHDFLIQTCRYNEENANAAAADLIEKEQLFYSCLMEIYLSRDNAALANLDTKTEEITNAYRNLLTTSVKAIESGAELDLETKTQQLSQTIEKLSDKNKDLGNEIAKLNEDMDATIKEYSSAFRNQSQQGNKETSPEKDEKNTPPPQDIQVTATTTPPDNNEVASPPGDDEAAAEPIKTTTATIKTDTSEPDDSIEPEFHNRGINDPIDNDLVAIAAADNTPDQEQSDLEAMAAKLEAESENEEANPDIPLDGLGDDNDPATTAPAENKAQQGANLT